MKFTCSIAMLSDWQVSTGSVHQGALDSVVFKDADGLPALPFTTIRGIWRDSAERLAYALNKPPKGDWHAVVDKLFGEDTRSKRFKLGPAPQHARLRINDGQLPKGLRDGILEEKLQSTLTFVKPGVAIDHGTGLAKHDHLRFEEVARGGVTLEAEGEVLLDDIDAKEAKVVTDLLWASFKLIKSIGGNRRRGSGLVVTKIGTDELLDTLKRLKDSEAPLLQSISKPKPEWQIRPSSNGQADYHASHLQVTLKQSAVIPRDVLGNVVTSLDHIPGTFLIAAVTAMMANPQQAMADVAAGEIIIEPAYIQIADQRARVVPALWHNQKDDTGGPQGKGKIFVKAGETITLNGENAVPGNILKPLPAGYRLSSEAGIAFAKPAISVAVRNTVDDEKQKPDDAGGVFVYEHLAAGQTFVARVLVSAQANTVWKNLQGTALLGRAKYTGYGLAELSVTPGETLKQIEMSGEGSVVCESPLLLDQHQTPAEAVAASLGLDEDDIDLKKSMLRYTRVDGWSGAWHLPKPSLFALRAGSVIAVKDLSKIQTLLLSGAGRRRGEGYGRLSLVDDTILCPSQNRWDPLESDGMKNGRTDTATAEDDPLLARLRRLKREAGIRLAVEQIASVSIKRETLLGWDKQMSPSQMGSLRSVMGNFDESRETTVRKLLLAWAKSEKKPWAVEACKTFLLEKDKLSAQLKNCAIEDAEDRRYALKALVHSAMKFQLRGVN